MLIISILDVLFQIYWWILIGRFALSWVPNVDYSHPVVKFIHTITDPVVRPFRGIIPPHGNIDFSPLILFLILRLTYPLLKNLLVDIIFRLGMF